ncbi:MAG TPA: hypothetical protein VN207_08175, partial [Ktedonobacteraceae bacterium]|nr:hypothetical protein [Ktedonobacteraceae bacterium]
MDRLSRRGQNRHPEAQLYDPIRSAYKRLKRSTELIRFLKYFNETQEILQHIRQLPINESEVKILKGYELERYSLCLDHQDVVSTSRAQLLRGATDHSLGKTSCGSDIVGFKIRNAADSMENLHRRMKKDMLNILKRIEDQLQQSVELQEQNAALQEQIKQLLVEQYKRTINLLIPSVSEKLKHIYPLRYISTTLLKEPIRRTLADDSDPSPVEDFFACCSKAFHIRYTAQRYLELTGEERRKILEESLPEVQRKLDRTLENAEKDLRSKLRAKPEETFNAIDEVRQYWESHKEGIINSGSLTIAKYEEIEYSLIARSTEYFEERVEFSPSSPTGTVRTTKRTPEAKGLLDRIKEILPDEPHRARKLESSRSDLLEKLKNDFSRLDRNCTAVSEIKEIFLDYEKRKFNGKEESPGFVAKVNSLKEDWEHHQERIKAVFEQNVYENGMLMLETIAKKNYSSKEMTLELAKEIANDNNKIWNIEVILNYTINRANMAWLEKPEDPQDDQKLVEATTAKFDNLGAEFVKNLINKARSLDQWVRSNDPRVTPDVVEKIGQLLTQAHHDFDFVLTPRREGTEQGHEPLSSQQQNLNLTIGHWDDYRERGGHQPPIYLRDLLPEERHDTNLFLIDPSKITLRQPDPQEACTTEKMAEMKEDRNKQLKALQEELEKKWTSILENNPNLKRLFNGFSPRNFWRLCIDKKFQSEDPISSSDAMNHDMPGCGFEPYFLVGTMKGLILTLAKLG